jgi:serine protease Do
MNRAINQFDNYLDGKLTAAEKADFEQRLTSDTVFAQAFEQHRILLKGLNDLSEKKVFQQFLKDTHAKEIGNSKVISLRGDNFARRHGKTIAVAASTAFVAVLSTVAILSTGGYLLTQQSNQITDLNREVRELKASSDAIVQGIKNGKKKVVYAPANLEGSAFAINNKGFIITSYHTVKDADSIFIQNKETERNLTRLVMFDPRLDLAVLKIENQELVKSWQVPFVIKVKPTDVGEKVFTLGYPRNEMVYGEGALSSLSGYRNDTSMYQVSIPVNPGNSGGPLLDEQGNVIGVIRGKIAGAEATGFAIKATEIVTALSSFTEDTIKIELASGGRKSGLKNLKRSEQVKKVNPYVFNVLVYKKD